jgi:hypothetical protein
MSKELQTTRYELSNTESTIKLADELAKFIKERKLYSNIQGKAYVNVEGWAYAGTNLGIVPIILEAENLSTEGEYKYRASVELVNIHTDKKVGFGIAICSNKEKSKKYFDEYAICSMAQTRAIGKAYRNLLAWIIKAAGYEPTPAEEMEGLHQEESKPTPKKEDPKQAAAKEDPKQEAPTAATVDQKAELLRLINSQVFTNEQKNKMIAQINTLTADGMTEAIIKTRAKIKVLQKGKEAAHA